MMLSVIPASPPRQPPPRSASRVVRPRHSSRSSVKQSLVQPEPPPSLQQGSSAWAPPLPTPSSKSSTPQEPPPRPCTSPTSRQLPPPPTPSLPSAQQPRDPMPPIAAPLPLPSVVSSCRTTTLQKVPSTSPSSTRVS